MKALASGIRQSIISQICRATFFCSLALAAVFASTSTSRGALVLSGGGLTLLEEGPPSATAGLPDVPTNLALGKTAFALDELGLGTHFIANVTNGSYGNSSSWIGGGATGVDGPFIGVDLAGTFAVDGIAFGRSNVLAGDPCGGGVCTDRTLGLYTLQYTRVASPTSALVTTGDATTGWVDIGTLDYGAAGGTNYSFPSRRHRFEFDPVAASGLRLIVPATGLGGGTAIDEIEVYAAPTPEPSTILLMVLGLVALSVRRGQQCRARA